MPVVRAALPGDGNCRRCNRPTKASAATDCCLPRTTSSSVSCISRDTLSMKTQGKRFFVAGTDTGVGKTLVTSALLLAAGQRGHSTLGLKPVAAGCEQTEAGLRNEDALALQAASSVKISYEQTNPIALAEAIAP